MDIDKPDRPVILPEADEILKFNFIKYLHGIPPNSYNGI